MIFPIREACIYRGRKNSFDVVYDSQNILSSGHFRSSTFAELWVIPSWRCKTRWLLWPKPRVRHTKVRNVSLLLCETLSRLFSVLSDYLMYGDFFLLDIEKQIQQLQAQRSNLPKVDIGEKVGTS